MRQNPATERAAERRHLLDLLLAEREGLLSVLDRVLALRGTARLIREAAGADAGFLGERVPGGGTVIRWTDGTRTDALQDLAVDVGRGVGGRALMLGEPVRVRDYVSAPTITHDYDERVRREALGALVAVPVLDRDCPLAVAYAGLHGPGTFGDAAVDALRRAADRAVPTLRLADAAAANVDGAVAVERRRMQASLHDSVGALLFSIGAQVRDLRADLPDNPALAGRLTRIEAEVSEASRALREALLALAESSPERALPVELAEHCRSFQTRTGVTCRFVQLGPVAPLDGERTAILVAVAREGLLNAEKHAGASTVIVSLAPDDAGGVQLAVADDGGVAEPATSVGSGLGVRMLAARAERLGGRVGLIHDEDGGTTLRVALPAAPVLPVPPARPVPGR
ncbi:GAF domain-containing protein [Pseudonocardia sp. NPDC049154]|uniref:GAF domain-containing sensor histidine kinase n=1 Tax=Pseudonocardia sp. NPDC049154 TaxID=3155501 RepID=UPI0033D30983